MPTESLIARVKLQHQGQKRGQREEVGWTCLDLARRERGMEKLSRGGRRGRRRDEFIY
jgi:hypothetical protein